MEHLLSPENLVSLLTLTFLEIVLGIDNIIFISIAAGRLPQNAQKKARNIGLLLAMAFRVILLFFISFIMQMSKPFAFVDWNWLKAGLSGQSIILFVGGLFLLYKATAEIHDKLEGDEGIHEKPKGTASDRLTGVVLQIAAINIVFSIDSILTALGVTTVVPVMIAAVIISIVIMMTASGPVGEFVNRHPSVQMLGLAFLILIGFMLLAEAAHLANLEIFHSHIGSVPKGYLYFAIFFSLAVEFLNLKLRKKQDPPVKLRNENKLNG